MRTRYVQHDYQPFSSYAGTSYDPRDNYATIHKSSPIPNPVMPRLIEQTHRHARYQPMTVQLDESKQSMSLSPTFRPEQEKASLTALPCVPDSIRTEASSSIIPNHATTQRSLRALCEQLPQIFRSLSQTKSLIDHTPLPVDQDEDVTAMLLHLERELSKIGKHADACSTKCQVYSSSSIILLCLDQ